jgi:hypothetical protein
LVAERIVVGFAGLPYLVLCKLFTVFRHARMGTLAGASRGVGGLMAVCVAHVSGLPGKRLSYALGLTRFRRGVCVG